jgi:hypothetical protein
MSGLPTVKMQAGAVSNQTAFYRREPTYLFFSIPAPPDFREETGMEGVP